MSVWDSVESLCEYTYKTVHVQFVRRRKEWFEKLDQPIYALWWQPAGQLPTVAEAKTRLDHLIQHGDSPTAFTFGNHSRRHSLPGTEAPGYKREGPLGLGFNPSGAFIL